jgi:hypothetical protein
MASIDAAFKSSPGPQGVTLKKLQIEPSPPSIRKPLIERWTFTNASTIGPGTTMLAIYKMGTTEIGRQRVDFTAELEKSGLTCPLAPGTYEWKWSHEIPSRTPPFVTVCLHSEIRSVTNDVLLTVDVDIKFVP